MSSRPAQWYIVFASVLLAFIVLAAAAGYWKSHTGGSGFLLDRAYLDMASARCLLTHQVHGLDASLKIPAVRDVLWRGVICLGAALTGSYSVGAYLAGIVCAGFLLYALMKLLYLLTGSFAAAVAAALLAIGSPGFVMNAMSGTSVPLAGALLVGACIRHAKGMLDGRRPLPLSAAVLTGLAATVHLPLAAVWGLLTLHALLAGGKDASGDRTAFVIIRAVNGLLVIAMCLAPLVIWNQIVFDVPWPRLPSGESAGAASLPEAFRRMLGTPFLSTWAVLAAAAASLLVAAFLPLRDRSRRMGLLLPLLIAGLPIICAAFAPFTGWTIMDGLPSATEGLWVALLVYGIHRIFAAVEQRVQAGGAHLHPPFDAAGLTLAATMALLILILPAGVTALRQSFARNAAVQTARNGVLDIMRSQALSTRMVASDAPGWIAYRTSLPVIDLTGETSPDLLAHLDERGNLPMPAVIEVVKAQRPDFLILWSDRYREILKSLPVQPLTTDPARRPFVGRLPTNAGS